MPSTNRLVKRVVLGRALRSDRQSEQELPKRLALPDLRQRPAVERHLRDAGAARRPDPRRAGLPLPDALPRGRRRRCCSPSWCCPTASWCTPTRPAAATTRSRRRTSAGAAGGVVASALLVDYVLTVAVSVSAGVDNIISAAEGLADHRVALALGFVAFLTAMNLRGVKESGKAFAVPTYGFVARRRRDDRLRPASRRSPATPPQAESAGYTVVAEHGQDGLDRARVRLPGAARVRLRLHGARPASRRSPTACRRSASPRARTPPTTLALMGGIAMSMFVGITALALLTDVRYSEDPASQFVEFGDGEVQRSVIAQVAAAVFGDGSAGFFYLQVMAAGILILAANTAYNGFPLLGLDPGPGPLPAAPAAHPRRPARLQQRHPAAGRLRRRCSSSPSTRASPGSSSSTSSASSPRSPSARPAWCGTGTGCCAAAR